jgi:hypothetical protein
MMKRFIFIIVLLSLLNAGGATATEEEKGGTEVTAALKAWINEWKHVVPGSGRTISDSVIVLVGPAAEVKFRNGIVIEASYLMSASDYKLSEAGVTSEFDRRDLDLAIGNWLNRFIGFFVGYRNSSFKEKGTGNEEFSYGLTYSLHGAVPFIGSSSLYGNLTYLDTRFKAEGLAREEAPGWITEIGGRMVFTEQIAMKLGYKWETTEGETSKVKDSFRGTVLELTYAF